MKLSKKLLAGALATSMLATGSTAFAAVTYGDGLTKVGDTDVYTGTGTSKSTAVNDKAKHAVTGTAKFTDDISVEITWGALTYSFTRTWDTETGDWKNADWETTTGSGKISATNKSAKNYMVKLAFDHTKFDNNYENDTKVNYDGVSGKFYSTEITKLNTEDDLTGYTEQSELKLDGKDGTNKTKASYLWLSGNPKNKDVDKESVVGKYGFEDGKAEVFGTVTATLANEDGTTTGQGGN